MRNKIKSKLPILVKIAPDLTDEELKDIAAVLTRKKVFIKINYNKVASLKVIFNRFY